MYHHCSLRCGRNLDLSGEGLKFIMFPTLWDVAVDTATFQALWRSHVLREKNIRASLRLFGACSTVIGLSHWTAYWASEWLQIRRLVQ